MRCYDLFDMHCHLGFCGDAAAAARELAALGVGAFSNTVTPTEFAAQREVLAGAENVRVGVGLHPWWVGEVAGALGGESCEPRDAGGKRASRNCAFVDASRCAADAAAEAEAAGVRGPDALPDGESFADAVARERFVGEVGLDFSPARVATCEAQVAVLSQVARACAQAGDKVVSLHAVRATDDVLDVLERAGALADAAGNACVVHWFSGTSDQLTRARRLGCFFSVNPRMLQSKRGRTYAKAIPVDRLLLETDLPGRAGEPWDAARVRHLLEQTLQQLAAARGEDADELGERIAATSRQLLA